jgi:single-stranded DNA-specific DHH superfamily exonuclease
VAERKPYNLIWFFFLMLTEKENMEIREHLNSAASPLFYFDNDQDGLCSYLLLRRMIGKGAGVPVKTSPLDMGYFRRIKEFDPDVVFILDQPTVAPEFFEALKEANVKVIWIDHHEIDLSEVPDWVYYYNPLYSGIGTHEPVTALCYEITPRKNDFWLAVIGCIADRFIPSFYSDFLEKYPDLGIDSDDPFEIFYNSTIGRIARMFGVGLKDRTSLVVKMIKFLSEAKTPYDVLEETRENHTMHKRFSDIDFKFKKLIEKAKFDVDDSNFLFFKYSGETSMSADIANKLSYLFPGKYIVVAFVKGVRVNLSMRGVGIRGLATQVIEKIPYATCGGHDDAVGAQMEESQLEGFVVRLRQVVGSK